MLLAWELPRLVAGMKQAVRRLERQIMNVRDGRRAGVALMLALMAPLLLAITGLAVDIGYWYQAQTSLQSAADAAAMAAGQAAQTYNESTSNVASFTTSTGQVFAVAAANAATNGKYSFTGTGAAHVTVTASVGGQPQIVTFTAVATIPRNQFFSQVAGLGFTGLGPGVQSASAEASYAKTSAPPCGYVGDSMNVTNGGGLIKATNCALYAGNISATSFSTVGSAQIIGVSGVETPASSVTATGWSYIGTNPNGGSGNDTSTVSTNSAQVADPMAGFGAPPAWPNMPNFPEAPDEDEDNAPYKPDLGYNTWNQPGVGDCTQLAGNYSGACELYPNYLTKMNSIGGTELVLNQGTSNGSTYITGGFGGGISKSVTLNGNNYYIDGGINFGWGGSFTANAGTRNTDCGDDPNSDNPTFCFIVSGGSSWAGGPYSFPTGTYYWWGPTSSSGAVNGLALTLNTPNFTLGGGTYYVNGGAVFKGGTTTVNVGPGNYFFAGYNSSAYGLNDKDSNVNFSGGVYYFNGGLALSDTGTITFGPGVYYIENGPFLVSGSGKVVANDATFILEDGAYYYFDGAGSVTLNAPTSSTTDCVDYTQYPVNSSTFPYDGTNRAGICGVAIYQTSNNADSIIGGANATITGSVYSPKADLTTATGSSGLTITSSGMPSLDVNSIIDNNSGPITLTENNQGSGSGSGSAASVLLVH